MASRNTQSPIVQDALKQRSGIPDSWIKAAGILRKSAKKNVAELKKNRRDWDRRMKTFEKRWHSHDTG